MKPTTQTEPAQNRREWRTDQTFSRLKLGMIVEHDGRPFEVVMVNDCRARIEPVKRKIVKVTLQKFDGETGEQKAFSVPQRESYNISPNSEMPILAKDKATFLAATPAESSEENKQQTSRRRKETMPTETKKEKKEKGPSKCAYIDELLLPGNLTLDQVWTKVKAKYPSAKKESTLNTIHSRRSRVRKKSAKAGWVEEKSDKPKAEKKTVAKGNGKE